MVDLSVMVLVPLVRLMPIGLDSLNSSPAAPRVHDRPVHGNPDKCT